MIARYLLVFVTALGLAQQQPEQHTEYSRTRFEVIVPLLRQARYTEAEKLTRELLRKAEAALPANSLEIGRILHLLGDCRLRAGFREDQETLEIFERSARIKTAVLGLEHDEAISTRLIYAYALSGRGRLSEARAIREQILSIFERDRTRVSSAAANALNDIAVQLYEAGESGRARPYVERALAMAEQIEGPEGGDVAHVLSTLGFVLQSSGDPAGSKAALERAMRIREKTLGENARLTIASYNNLASALAVLHEGAEAKRLYEKANAARLKLLGPNHPDNAIGMHNLGGLLIDMGDFSGARAILDQAIDLRVRTLGENHFLSGTTYTRLALAELGLARYDQALAFANKAVDILRRTLGPGHPNTISAMGIQAVVLSRLGQANAAFNRAVETARASNDHSRLTAQTLAERAALAYGVNEYVSAQETATHLVVENSDLGGGTRREAWDLWMRSRSLVLDEVSARLRLVAQTSNTDLIELQRDLQSTRRLLSRLVLSSGTAERIQATLERKDQLEREIGQRSAPLRRDLKRAQLGFAEVAANLPSKSALVSLVRYRQDRGGFLDKGVPVYVAFVLRAGEEEPSVVRIGDESAVEALIKDWRAQIALAAADPTRAGRRAETLARTAGIKLRQRVWDPIEPQLRGMERVFVVPDGAMHLINFAALPTGTDRYLVETGPLIHILAAERDLVPLADDPRQAPQNRTMLAMANPAFSGAGVAPRRLAAGLRGTTPACADLRKMQFLPLPYTAAEVDEISRLWPAGAGRNRPVVLSGVAANESAFRNEAPGKRIVHVATHGFFLGEQCGGGGSTSLAGEAATQSPLVLSGLALAGANRRYQSKEDEEDGLLTAEEVAGLPLDGVEWVVLSGCDTGLGQVRSQEGVFGLRRAFQTAGAGTVIMSLWPVEDQAAREWMRGLYAARLSKGMSTAESLREASRAMLASRRASGKSTHPFFWAAFVGAGDWR